MMTQEQFTNDAVELLKKLIATPSVSRNEKDAADIMEQTIRSYGVVLRRPDMVNHLSLHDFSVARGLLAAVAILTQHPSAERPPAFVLPAIIKARHGLSPSRRK